MEWNISFISSYYGTLQACDWRMPGPLEGLSSLMYELQLNLMKDIFFPPFHTVHNIAVVQYAQPNL